MQVKVFTANNWQAIDSLEERINQYLRSLKPSQQVHSTNIAMTAQGNGAPAAIATVWHHG